MLPHTGKPAVGPDFIFDPVCVYDDINNRFVFLAADFVTVNASTGVGDYTKLLIAVSINNNPSNGFRSFDYLESYFFADFPHIGIDKDNVFITYNNFTLPGEFIGAGICGISLNILVNAVDSEATSLGPETCVYLWEDLPANRDCVSSVSPTRNVNPNDGESYSAQNGVHHFITVDCTSAEEMDVITLTNTLSLDSGSPSLSVQWSTIDLGFPKVNPYNFEWYNKAGGAQTEPYTTDNGDGRSADAIFFNNTILGCFSTVMTSGGSDIVVVAYAWIPVYWENSTVKLDTFDSSKDAGVIGLSGSSLIFPIVTVTEKGQVVLGFAIVGMTYFPTAAFVAFNPSVDRQTIYIAGAGLTALQSNQEQPYRYGDYSSAYSNGEVVFLYSEYVEKDAASYDANLKNNYVMYLTKLNLTSFDWNDVIDTTSSGSDDDAQITTIIISVVVVGFVVIVAVLLAVWWWSKKNAGEDGEKLSANLV